MTRNRSLAGGLLALAALSLALAGCRKALTEANVVASMRQVIDSASAPAGMAALRWQMIQAVYRERKFLPLWTSLAQPTERGLEFINAIAGAEAQGLRSSDYHLKDLRDFLARAYDPKLARDSIPGALSRLDLHLTTIFFEYGTHLFSGRLEPAAVDSGWYIAERRSGVDTLLLLGLTRNSFAEMVAPLYPKWEEYGRLLLALAHYRALAARGGWDSLPVPPVRARFKLEPDGVDSIVPQIRRRLLVTGELTDSSTTDPYRYDSMLAGAVAVFQDRHGLEMDSVIGRGTIEAMNVPVEMRIGQIELNMERYRWLPDNLGPRYILVNIPDYHLYAFDEGKEVFQMRVVVGKDYDNPTPVFADSMSYIVFRPYWNVPSRILKEEIVPAARKDTGYIAKNNYEILRGREVIDPATIEWAKVDTSKINFYIRQRPGPLKSLGLVKFMFPNQFDVYLHDTPARSLFRRAGRAASHGCIRVERPEQLAQFALARNPEWDLRKIRDAMRRDSSQQVGLRQKVPVYIVYFTSFVRDGVVRFRSDLYGTDRRAIARLREGGDQPDAAALRKESLDLAQAGRKE
jgi:murein L,D-transpeptidase YcbB/YkuD